MIIVRRLAYAGADPFQLYYYIAVLLRVCEEVVHMLRLCLRGDARLAGREML
jgi:hypothetical protein